MQTTSNILMIRPVKFGFNEQTALSNAFQNPDAARAGAALIQLQAQNEFDHMVAILQQHGVDVIVVEDTIDPHKPDSIFPNNWISFHEDGTVCLYPMHAPNRRQERRKDIIEMLGGPKGFSVSRTIDFTNHEERNKFLEGTGSLVLDRDNKVAYACISPRTHSDILTEFSEQTGYRVVAFNSVDKNGIPIYHTNVVMAIGDKFAVICLDTIMDEKERQVVKEELSANGREVVEITLNQMNNFAGNMLQVKSKSGESLLVMSQTAYNSLVPEQVHALEKYARLVPVYLHTIESNGGGSARCMMAEVHLPKVN
jgi:hypothetical protein